MTNHWLMKSEPHVYSIDDLKRDRRAPWDGVRNFQARNFMRAMKKGDMVLFYHSSAEPSGVAGLARVCRDAYPDATQFDKKSEYYEPRASREKPVWDAVEVEFVKKLPRLLSLSELKKRRELRGMILFRKGSRLSVQPVEKTHFDWIVDHA